MSFLWIFIYEFIYNVKTSQHKISLSSTFTACALLSMFTTRGIIHPPIKVSVTIENQSVTIQDTGSTNGFLLHISVFLSHYMLMCRNWPAVGRVNKSEHQDLVFYVWFIIVMGPQDLGFFSIFFRNQQKSSTKWLNELLRGPRVATRLSAS